MKTLLSLVVLLVAALIPSQLVAQDMASALAERHYGNIAYISGGIGEAEQDDIRAREQNFNVKLLFAERDGSYLGDVDVVLLDRKGGTVFEARSVGPFLLVQLPGGDYGIHVALNGQMQQGRLTVPANGRREAVFRW